MLVFPFAPQIDLKETVLLKLDAKKVDLSSLVVSPDRSRVACTSADKKYALLDGKRFGPFVATAPPVFSGDSRSFAFAAMRDNQQGGEMYLNGEYVKTEYEVTRVLRLGDSGPIAWTERGKPGVRLCTNEFKTEWMPRLVRSAFSTDGKGFSFIFTALPKDAADNPPEFLMQGNTPAVPRARTLNCFPAPGGLNFLSVHLDVQFNSSAPADTGFGDWNGQRFVYLGKVVGLPVFNTSGSAWAVRSEYTGVTPKGNMQFSKYTTSAGSVRELDIQNGFSFRPGSESYVLCGKRGDDFFIKKSPALAVPYADFPGLDVAPREFYRGAAWSGNNVILLFQSKKTKPSLFFEGKGLVDLNVEEAMPASLSVSPDGKYLALNVTKNDLPRVMVIPVDNPLQMTLVGKEDFVVDQPEKAAPLWIDNRSLRFLGLRKGQLLRMDATIKD
ncbi:MAG: hypothetical protein WCK51_02740 [Armatimonadota bacterium]